VLNNVPTPYNPTLIGPPKWVFGSRTGGADDNHWIDDLCIVALTGTTFCSDFNSGPPAGTSLFGAANVSGGFLQLTPALNTQFGIAYIDDFGRGSIRSVIPRDVQSRFVWLGWRKPSCGRLQLQSGAGGHGAANSGIRTAGRGRT
jgi:hypothetical protein